jgi:hypothetical protein
VRGFGDGLHEGIVSLMAMDYLENILVSTAWASPAPRLLENHLRYMINYKAR